MSEQKPTAHPMVRVDPRGRGIQIDTETGVYDILSQDEAVALGYALFEHGLYMKGRMKPLTTIQEKP